MRKLELIEKIAADAKVNKAEAERSIDALISGMIASLRQTGKFGLAGVGVFKVRTRKPRTARNPKTGAQVQVPERKTVGFKACREIKEAIK
jgi:DNA-binding protein HU-beta